jgi:hypothetical protein
MPNSHEFKKMITRPIRILAANGKAPRNTTFMSTPYEFTKSIVSDISLPLMRLT